MFCNVDDVFKFSEEDKREVEERVVGEVDKWMDRFDCLVIGPGLGRDPFLLVYIAFLFVNNTFFVG